MIIFFSPHLLPGHGVYTYSVLNISTAYYSIYYCNNNQVYSSICRSRFEREQTQPWYRLWFLDLVLFVGGGGYNTE